MVPFRPLVMGAGPFAALAESQLLIPENRSHKEGQEDGDNKVMSSKIDDRAEEALPMPIVGI